MRNGYSVDLDSMSSRDVLIRSVIFIEMRQIEHEEMEKQSKSTSSSPTSTFTRSRTVSSPRLT